MTKEDIQEYLDCNGFEALTHVDGNKYYDEKTVISIALEVVKNCSIPDVVQQREQFKSMVFDMANKLAIAGNGDEAVIMHKIHNRL